MDNLVGIDLGLSAAKACSCCLHGNATGAAEASATAASVQDFEVAGMTCSHCVSSVVEELSSIGGVRSVTVDLNVGGHSRVTVASDLALTREAVRTAVDEAGYRLVGAG